MARQKKEFVSSFGTSFEIFKALAEEVYSSGGDDSDLRYILKYRELRRGLAKQILVHAGKIFPLDIFGNNIAELVKQGKYDLVNSDINDGNFQADEMHQCEVGLQHFARYMSEDEVHQILGEEGLRAASMSELLELGSRYPQLQEDFEIVALGSVWEHGQYRSVGSLHCIDGQRGLGLSNVDLGFSGDCRFATVRK